MAEENRTAPAPEQDIHEQKRIRMEKLDELKADGRDPFTITKFDVTAKAHLYRTGSCLEGTVRRR